MHQHEVLQNIKIAYFHYGYLQKKACINIIHLIEKYRKYELYDEGNLHGFHEQLEWESLVIVYLEQTHAFIDKQRKAYKALCNFTNHTYDEERKKIIGENQIEHRLIVKARNAIHHNAFQITRFSVDGNEKNMAVPSPNIEWYKVDLSQHEKDYVNKHLPLGGLKLIPFFSNHCSNFITSSAKLGQFLIDQLNRNKALNEKTKKEHSVKAESS